MEDAPTHARTESKVVNVLRMESPIDTSARAFRTGGAIPSWTSTGLPGAESSHALLP